MSSSGFSYAKDIAGKRSVPKHIASMRIVDRGKGT
jgi:hypothetical protein